MYHKLIIVGRLGRDPEMRYMPDGSAVTTISVATDRGWTDKTTGQLTKETTWFRVSIWGKQAETANHYMVKGSTVLIEGHLRSDPQTGGPRIYTRQDGTAGTSYEISAESWKFVGDRKDGSAPIPAENQSAGNRNSAANEIDDIPF